MSIIDKMNSFGKKNIPFFFIFDFELNNIHAFSLKDAQKNGFLFNIEGYKNYDEPDKNSVPTSFLWQKKPITIADYTHKFKYVQDNILLGNSFLCNLTCSTPIETDLTLEQIFYYSKAKYKLWHNAHFVCFSPEIFIKIDAQGTIASHPMKGTIDASIPNAEQLIINDLKEKAEHYTIVDLIRNDLSKVAKKVNVTKFRYLDLIETNEKSLYQVSSEIQGQLPEDWKENIGTILMKLLPAGSISGAPKNSTVNIIKNAEQTERGYYTGIFGLFDGSTLNSGVMIRFIEQIEGKMFFKSGGGITAFSDLNTEYQELIHKIYVPIPRNDTN